MADIGKQKFEKLNNTNYANWKFRVELLLRKQNWWKNVIIDGRSEPILNTDGDVTNETDINKWDELDDETRGMIGLAVDDDQLAHIRTKTTAKVT